ncbi:unnamed protein product [Auanema sp. JU1783]|nr:unnamed protein product [Auanema sp. JU1783]
MVWRIVRQVLNNEKVIQELSETAPMKAAAKAIVRGAATAEQKIRSLNLDKKVEKYTKIYKEEYQKALKDK